MDLVTPSLGLLFWQTVTFITLLVILSKFAWKPIVSALNEREATISKALNAAENAKAELANLQATNEKLLLEARIERDNILKEATNAANSLIAEAKDKANAEGSRLIEKARLTIENEKKSAITEMRNQAAGLAIEIAEKLIKKELSTDSAKEQLVSEYIKDSNLN
jgi:F-type H+-transporting ATPase subunit b